VVGGSTEALERLERRFMRVGFKSCEVREAARAVRSLDAMTVMDYLVLHTPDHSLPHQLREKKKSVAPPAHTPTGFLECREYGV
jgi:hypothetical protein